MKPDWDKLASAHDSDKVLIADVDCTGTGEKLCERFGVQGFPTIKYFNPPDEEGEDYEGGRDFDDLDTFAKENLGPGCSASTKENCTEEQIKELEEVLKMPEAERTKELDALSAASKKASDDHDALLKSLQSQYEESNEAVEKLKKDTAPRIKLLKSANAKPAAAAGKDEM